MILEKRVSDMQQKLLSEGYIVIKNFFNPSYIKKVRRKAQKIFQIQFDYFGYNESFDSNMIKLFNEQQEIFINCGKLIQTGLIELYQLAVNRKLITELKKTGIKHPNLCTRPVLFFNHPELAKEEIYYKTPPHQDWPSMLSSSDSVVVWIPLVDVDKNNGSIIIWPNSHSAGVLPFNINGGFAQVEPIGEGLRLDLQVGDIVIFSTFLVHSSGDIINNTIRWSCHFRYTNMKDEDFIKRGFPNPYIYKPITKQ